MIIVKSSLFQLSLKYINGPRPKSLIAISTMKMYVNTWSSVSNQAAVDSSTLVYGIMIVIIFMKTQIIIDTAKKFDLAT